MTDKETKKITIRIPADLHQQIAEAAKLDERKINGEIITLIREALAARARQR